MDSNTTGFFDGSQKYLHWYALDESSLNIGRVKEALNAHPGYKSELKAYLLWLHARLLISFYYCLQVHSREVHDDSALNLNL